MEIRLVYLACRTAPWHSLDSRELVYAGENVEDILARPMACRGMGRADAKEVRNHRQTQCNNRGNEWEVKGRCVNTFSD